jgi:hypothetical protein
MQFDVILGHLRQLLDDGTRAAALAGQTPDFSDLQRILTTLEGVRNDEMTDLSTQLETLFTLIKNIATGIGAGLLAIAILACIGALLLVRASLCLSLLQADGSPACACTVHHA